MVTRLERALSGIVVAAKTRPALAALREMAAAGAIRMEYGAVVHGDVAACLGGAQSAEGGSSSGRG